MKFTRKAHHFHRRFAVLFGALSLAGLLALYLPWPQAWEQILGLEMLYSLRGPRAVAAPVVVIGIDGASAQRLGLSERPDQWSRQWHAKLIDHLHAAGAASISFDMLFDQSRNAADDQRLAQAIRAAGNVSLVEYLRPTTQAVQIGTQTLSLHIEQQTPPLPLLAAAAVATAPFPLPKFPHRTDQFWTFKPEAGDAPTLPAVALQVFAHQTFAQPAAFSENITTYLRQQRSQKDNLLPTRPASMPTSAAAMQAASVQQSLTGLYKGADSRYLNFYGPPGSLPHLSYDQALQTPAERFKGKAVFVGLMEFEPTRQRDTYLTVYSNPQGVDMSGVEIGATAFANLWERADLQRLDYKVGGWISLAWGLLLALLWSQLRPSRALLLSGIAAAVYLSSATSLFTLRFWWLPVITPVLLQLPLAVALGLWGHYRHAEWQKNQLRQAFARYLPSSKVDRLIENLGPLPPTGSVYSACLISDIADYTQLAESLDPAALHAWMNRYLAVLFPIIEQHHGMVMDATGDAVLAVWVTSTPAPAPCHSACQTAFALQHALQSETGAGRLPNGQPVSMRIGLHCGEIYLGALGTEAHADYRAVGDIVNTASRIQGLNKPLGTQILASRALVAALPHLNKRPLGRFRLMGKRHPLELVELQEMTRPDTESLQPDFQTGLGHYQAAQFDLAHAVFDALLQRFPEDGPSLYYRDLCKRQCGQVLPAHWAGEVTLTHK